MDGFAMNEMAINEALESLAACRRPIPPDYPSEEAKPQSILQAGYKDAFSHWGSVSNGVVVRFKLELWKDKQA